MLWANMACAERLLDHSVCLVMQGIYYTFVLKLNANKDQANTFAVVSVPKKDTFMTTGEPQTIRSTLDPKFGVKLPDKCLPRNSKVELKVMN